MATIFRQPLGRNKTTYVPVYTLHEMHLETGKIPQLPVIICTGCAHPIPAPRGSADIQCRDCGKKMRTVSIGPAATQDGTN